MELTEEIAVRYVGGQLEVQNRAEPYIYRGEIASIELTGNGEGRTLSVNFAWVAKMNNDGWEVSELSPYRVSLMLYAMSCNDEGRIILQSSIMDDLIVIFPPGGSTLEPSKVHGLVLDAE